VQKSFQFNVAALCLILFSKTVLAAGITPVRLQPSAIPGFPASTGTFSPKKPIFGTAPKPLEVFENNKKLPGSFRSPQTELSKGNVTTAKVACIQEAIQNGDEIPIDDSSVWEFAADTSSKPSRAPTALQSKLLSSAHTPAAFAKKDACNNDIQHSACVALLSKATTEVTQAYYNSSLKTDSSVWDEVLSFLGLMPLDHENDEHMDVVDALKMAQDKANKGTGESDSIDLSPIENQDPLLVATQLLIQRIDESLARGDREGADKAKNILKKINPSAAYAASCVLGSVKLGGLNDNLDPSGRPQGSYFGPLSGIDYGKIDELKTHGNPVLLGIIATTVVALAYITQATIKNYQDGVRADETLRLTKIRDYKACTGSGCDALYPEAAATVKAARAAEKAQKEAEKQGAGGPGKPIDKIDATPPPKKNVLPPGSGGQSGEVVPLDPTPSGSNLSDKVKKEHAFDRHIDPEASERFCQKAVNAYKVFAIKKVTGTGRPIEGLPSTSDNPIPFGAFGVAQFDKWTPAYWAEQKKNRESDPEYLAKQNNCHAMDEAQGL